MGGLIDGKPLICGGYLSGHPMADSFSVNETKFERKSYLTQQRAFAASVLLNSKTLWVVGKISVKVIFTKIFVKLISRKITYPF